MPNSFWIRHFLLTDKKKKKYFLHLKSGWLIAEGHTFLSVFISSFFKGGNLLPPFAV
jgi:hypothetical protein